MISVLVGRKDSMGSSPEKGTQDSFFLAKGKRQIIFASSGVYGKEFKLFYISSTQINKF